MIMFETTCVVMKSFVFFPFMHNIGYFVGNLDEFFEYVTELVESLVYSKICEERSVFYVQNARSVIKSASYRDDISCEW